jgi:chaperonin GroEL
MIINGKEVKQKLKEGIDLVANTVKPTLGPQAKTVILQGNPPVVINDGVTITKYISSKDPYVQMGVQMVQNLASKAQDNSGDGTTTACIIAQALVKGIKEQQFYNMRNLQNEFKEAEEVILASLAEQAKPILDDDILNVATIAANNDSKLGLLIQGAINKVGRDGVITVEESKSHMTNLIVRDGLEFDEGYLSHMMSNGEDGKATFDNPVIFTSNLNIRHFQDILPLLELCARNKRPLVIICRGMEGTALSNVIMNVLQKTIEVVVVKAPNFGDAQLDELTDITAICGGRLFNAESKDDPAMATMDELGTADRIVVGKENTVIIGGEGDEAELKRKVLSLKELYESSEDKYDKMRLKGRIARLNGGVATIRIGASSSIEMREKKERLDDALNATKAALDEGIVIGGGKAFIIARQELDVAKTGHALVYDSLSAPICAIFDNSGLKYADYVHDIEVNYTVGKDYALNALTGKIENMHDAGIIDPVKVTKNSFLAAMSIANLFLSTEVAVLLEE